MIETLKLLLLQFPTGMVLFILGGVFWGIGFLLARKIWGGNIKRLKSALNDSAYLAEQWATLGIAQSHLVDKLGKKMLESQSGYREKEGQLMSLIRERDLLISRLEKQMIQAEESRSGFSEREMEAFQVQVEELQKRDARIRVLEARLHYLDNQNEKQIEAHNTQVRLLLDRIAALEDFGKGRPDETIQENNRQLTELLRQRCGELELLRDEFYAKERALNRLREQNTVLKNSDQDVGEGQRELERSRKILTEAKGVGRRKPGIGTRTKSVVYFKENSALVGEDDSKLIREIAHHVRETGDHITLQGFTESEGDEDFNRALSTRRAEVVSEIFEEAGVNPSLILIRGRGEDKVLSSTEDAWKARRVEILVLPGIEVAN